MAHAELTTTRHLITGTGYIVVTRDNDNECAFKAAREFQAEHTANETYFFDCCDTMEDIGHNRRKVSFVVKDKATREPMEGTEFAARYNMPYVPSGY